MSLVMDLAYKNFSKHRLLIEEWLSYPRYLQMKYGINPVIAGGAIRDTLLGGQVRNIDLFISATDVRIDTELVLCSTDYPAREDHDHIYEAWDEISYLIAEREGWSFVRYGHITDHTPGLTIYTFKHNSVPVVYNIVILPEDTSTQELLSQLNFGINTVAVNTYGVLSIGKAFTSDAEKQVITQLNQQPDDMILKSYRKISKKYPWPLHSKCGIELATATRSIVC